MKFKLLLLVSVCCIMLAGCNNHEPPVIDWVLVGNAFGLFSADYEAGVIGAEPLIYRWDVGDGTTLYGQTSVHDYGVGGEYTVTLTVTDRYGQSTRLETPVVIHRNVVCCWWQDDTIYDWYCEYPRTPEDRWL